MDFWHVLVFLLPCPFLNGLQTSILITAPPQNAVLCNLGIRPQLKPSDTPSLLFESCRVCKVDAADFFLLVSIFYIINILIKKYNFLNIENFVRHWSRREASHFLTLMTVGWGGEGSWRSYVHFYNTHYRRTHDTDSHWPVEMCSLD